MDCSRTPCPSLKSQSLPKSIELVMLFNHLILCCSFFLLPSIFISIRVFSNELALRIKWPKYWSFSFSISPSNEYLGLISFRIDRFAFLAVQGTLKSLLQHHNLKASVLWHSAFMVQFSHPYMTTGKIIALSIRTFVSNVMSLLFNTLSRSITAFLLRSKRLLSSSLQSPSAVILELKKRKFVKLPLFPLLFARKEKAMAPHSSTLAWKIPWMEEPGGLQFMGSLRVGHD